MVNDGFFHCDHCQGNSGLFNTVTGNHVDCERLAVLEFNAALMKETLTNISNLDEHSASSPVIEAVRRTIKALKELP